MRADIRAYGVGRTTNNSWSAGRACSGYASHLHVGSEGDMSNREGKAGYLREICLSHHVKHHHWDAD